MHPWLCGGCCSFPGSHPSFPPSPSLFWLGLWQIQSATLFRTCIVYCEESLTQDLHLLVPDLCSAFQALADQRDPDAREAVAILGECCELLGSFIVPENFIQFMVPRLKGDLEVLPGGVDDNGRALVLRVASGMMRGARPGEVLKHLDGVVDAITDDEVVRRSEQKWGAGGGGRDTVAVESPVGRALTR